MFENIIGRQEMVRTLSAELEGGEFPRASLFFGPAYGGKLSTALEVARVLTCRQGRGEWACECASCRAQRELAHPHTVLLGFRYSDVEIAASADALRKNRKPPTQFLFLRAVRKLTLRFDPLVWDAEESRIRAAQEKIARIEELLSDLAPGRELPPDDAALGTMLERIIEASAELAGSVKNDSVTVGQVRKLSSWAHLTATDSRKVAVIENADRMQESARNALLKLLEEPPDGVNLLLLSTRRSAIIPTVLSRLRPYRFPPRGPAEEAEVLAKIFRDESRRFQSLKGFFLAWKEINPEELARHATRFMDGILAEPSARPEVPREMEGLFGRGAQREAVTSFLEELAIFLHRALRQGGVPLDVLEEWGRAIREAQSRVDLANMNPQAVVESLFLRMRAGAAARRGAASPDAAARGAAGHSLIGGSAGGPPGGNAL